MKLKKDKILHTHSISDYYDSYQSERKGWDKVLTKSQYVSLNKDFLFEVSLLIIREKFLFKMPYKLGTIRIKRILKSKRPGIDWEKTKKLGKQVRYSNLHTDGKGFRWSWDKPRFGITNQSYYTFKATRDEVKKEIGTRGLAKYIKECSRDPYKKDYNCAP
jgi:hypothetical protein